MNQQLVEEGWLAPADPGPTRPRAGMLMALGIVIFLATSFTMRSFAATTMVDVAIGDDGGVTVDERAVDTELRERGGVRFLVARTSVDEDQRLQVALDLPAGLVEEQVAVRTLDPSGGDPGELVITVRADVLDRAPEGDVVGPLREVTAPFDARVRKQREDRRLLAKLDARSTWLLTAATGAFLLLPLWLWNRATRRWFSMRRPGPGTQLGVEPPSSLDPIGAAVLFAGARPVDLASAFAGHVLDLVERRQLPMRRSADSPTGTLIGMHHADDVDDVAVPILQTMLAPGDTSVLLPDNPARVRAMHPQARATWRSHVAGRARFEGAIERPPVRRLQLVAGIAAIAALAAAAAALSTHLEGRQALLWLVAACAAVLAITSGAWLLDARRWRSVTRSRRTERAQWLAWRERAADLDGPASDQRNLAVLVAVDAPLVHVRGGASTDAVDLDAATVPAIRGLRRALGDA